MRLAAGGMGVVYRGERVQLGRAVAIKFLHAPLAADKEFMRRFDLEARVLSRLGHPHCVSVIDFGVEDGAPYMVLDFVTGKNLREVMDAGALAPARALHIARQILAGLAHAHGQGIVHRDIKPANIMLSEATGTGDHVRILDFGLAKLRDAGPEASTSQLAVGTPSYMPPEQSRGGKVDARSDVYSMGVMLFELLTGRKPFVAHETFEVLEMHREAPIPTLRASAPDRGFSEELEVIILRAMAKAPEDRFQSAEEMLEALGAVPEARVTTRPSAKLPLAFASTTEMDVAKPPSSVVSNVSLVEEPPSASVRSTDVDPGEPLSVPKLLAPAALAPSPRELSQSTVVPPRSGSSGQFMGILLLLVAFGALAYWKLWPKKQPPTEGVRSSPTASPVASIASPPGPSARPPVSLPPGPMSEPTAAPEVGTRTPDAAVAGAAAPIDAAAPAPAPPDVGMEVDAGDELAALPSEEQDDPVALVPSDVPEAQIDEPPAPTPEPSARPVVKTVDDALALIKAGRKNEAVSALQQLRRLAPKSAYVPYLLGNLYFERRWYTQGLEAYRAAIANNKTYRARGTLNRNAIRALGADKTRFKATSLIRSVLGRAALPFLRSAAKSDPSSVVRQRAAALAKSIR